jgi:cobalt-zinc-cadmium efflux system outer membrane protein
MPGRRARLCVGSAGTVLAIVRSMALRFQLSRGLLGRFFVLSSLASSINCVSYRPEPLAAPTAAPMPRAFEAPRLRVSGNQWQRAGVTSLQLNLDDGLTQDEAAVLGVLLDPQLIAERDARGEARAQIIVAGILPNPTLGVEYAHPYAPSGSGASDVLNLSLSLDLKPFFVRSAKRDVAQAEFSQIDLGIAWQEWQVAQRARLLVSRLEWLQRRVKLAKIELEFEEQVASTLNKASAAGDATLGQVGVQRASLEGVRRSVHELEQSQLDAESELRELFGNPSLARIDVADAPPFTLVPPPSTAKCFEARFDLTALTYGYRAQEAAVRQAVVEQFPDLTIGVTHQHSDAALNFVGAFVNVGLPVFEHGRAQIEAARATRRRLRHEYDSRVVATRASLERLAQFQKLVSRQLAEVQTAIGPLEKIELDERSAVARGDLDRLSYQTVRTALFEQRLQEAALSQALAEAQIGVDTTCGPSTRSPTERG